MTKVIVIGAGITGIMAAKTWLDLDSNVDLVVLEGSTELGGTWSPGRVYPHLSSQQPTGFIEYSSMPMDRTGLGPQDFIPAERITKYLYQFVETFNLKKHIRFGAKVVKIEREGGVIQRGSEMRPWKVWVEGDTEPLICDKLIVASGNTSDPKMPQQLQGSAEDFGIPVFHSKYIPQNMERITSPETKRILVYGGGKFAVDCIDIARRYGKKVDWIIRDLAEKKGGVNGGGRGPPALTMGKMGGRNLLILFGNRFGISSCPSIDAEKNWHYRFYHSGKNSIGKKLSLGYWRTFGEKLYNGQVNKNENTKKLEVHLPGGIGLGVSNVALITEPEVIPFIHDTSSVTVHRASITSVSNSQVHLSNGDTLQPDMVICATGWTPYPTFFSPSDGALLGLPTALSEYPADLAEKWGTLEAEAQVRLREQFHLLAAIPTEESIYDKTPFRMYNHIIPPEMIKNGDTSLAFLGFFWTASTCIQAEVTSLWAYAYMTGRLTIPAEEVDIKTAERVANQLARWPKEGRLFPLYMLDWIPLMDHFLRELGLNPNRKGGFFAETFGAYRPSDYRGIIDEWKAKHGL